MAGDRPDGEAGRGLRSNRGGCRAVLDQPAAWPEADDWAVLRCLAIAAQKLSEGDEAGAQQALDASGPTRLSCDGAVLMRAVAGSLGIGSLDLPWADGPRLWRAEVIAAHLPLFKDYAPAGGLLAKAGAWDESQHPRWAAGSPDHQGGRFNHGEGGAVTEGRSVSSDDGNGEPPPEIPKERPPTREGRRAVVRGAANWLAEIANIWSPLEGPKSLEELQRAVKEPKDGYQVHHIVEQTPARDELL